MIIVVRGRFKKLAEFVQGWESELLPTIEQAHTVVVAIAILRTCRPGRDDITRRTYQFNSNFPSWR